MTRVRVELGPRAYEIAIGSDWSTTDFGQFARTCLDSTWAGRKSRSAFIITDQNVAALAQAYLGALEAIGFGLRWQSWPRARRPKASTRLPGFMAIS